MLSLNKYKPSIHINFENINELEKINRSLSNKINYTFTHKTKFMRNFIFFYSLFLIKNQISYFTQKNKSEFNINLDIMHILLLNNDYNFFYNI